MARLNYVHHNPVKHGLVQDARDYRWCSLRWFCDVAADQDAERILATPYDRVQVVDDF